MSFTIEIDEHSLEQTTRALRTINPGRSSADHIRDMVNANMRDGTTSLGTAGWEATGYFPDHKPGVMVVRLSVSAYSVNHWLKEQHLQKRLAKNARLICECVQRQPLA